MTNSKQLSNPFSTGSGGAYFESYVQASFVTLMLTGGYAPCLPCWPIVEIKFQGKVKGFDIDDLIVFVERPNTKERRKLLGQIKHSIRVTRKNSKFKEFIQAAWNDYNNPSIFTKGSDSIALITGPLSYTDTENVRWLLDQARHSKDSTEFFRDVGLAKFSSSSKREKLETIRHHFDQVSKCQNESDETFYDFLQHLFLLGYDFSGEGSVVLSLLHSHISQHHKEYPQWLWPRIVNIAQDWNKDAGTITIDNIPDDVIEIFKQESAPQQVPETIETTQGKPVTDWTNHQDATCLALIVLAGAWKDENQSDKDAVGELMGIGYEEWIRKAQEILPIDDSPLSIKRGDWTVGNRIELLNSLGKRILDHNMENFKSLAISILRDLDPAFDLPPNDRYAAKVLGKTPKYSTELRKGIAESLAIISNQPTVWCNHLQRNPKETCLLIVREVLKDADYRLWGSLNDILPILAESAPVEFLDAVDNALNLSPCPFTELSFQGSGIDIFSRDYLSGLVWAMERLAWDADYLVRVCMALGKLATHNLDGAWSKRPLDSLTTILLPWNPQTLAPITKRKAAVETLLNEYPIIGWRLILKLLPGKTQLSMGTSKPEWRKIPPDDWKQDVTAPQIRQQVSTYAEIAAVTAINDFKLMLDLIEDFNRLPNPAFDQLLQFLASQSVRDLPEEQRLPVWNKLTRLLNMSRRYPSDEWKLFNNRIEDVEQVSESLAPSNPFYLYQNLFISDSFDLHEENHNWSKQEEKLFSKRKSAIREIFQQSGIEGVIRFSERVAFPSHVGDALGTIEDVTIDQTLLPKFLSVDDINQKEFIGFFVLRRQGMNGWEWCDNVVNSDWEKSQIGQFLAYLPFSEETWNRASEWLNDDEREYWIRVKENACWMSADHSFAIDKFIKYGRPQAALICIGAMLHDNMPVDPNQGIQALLATPSKSESRNSTLDNYHMTQLIKYLQENSDTNPDDLVKVELAYLDLFYGRSDVKPKLLEGKLSTNPEFFCEVIQLTFRSRKEDKPPKEPTEEEATVARKTWHLLDIWKTPPGVQEDETFNAEEFTNWIHRSKELCKESGHLEVALDQIGQVLIHAPPDPDGLWIHKAIALELNDPEVEYMRVGFNIGKRNSRGVHVVDPTGAPERELAEEYRIKADAVENAHFSRFATSLRELAEDYERDAERVIAWRSDRIEAPRPTTTPNE